MLTLYMTRHGETVWNTEKRMQGWEDSELTERYRQCDPFRRSTDRR